MDCLILGDSIAVGVFAQRRECVSYVRGGWNSWQFNREYLPVVGTRRYRTAIVSLGANDHQGVRSERELRKLRAEIKADRVYWISPGARKASQLEAIEKIATEYGDVVLPRPEQYMSADGVHPTTQGYRTLARSTQ